MQPNRNRDIVYRTKAQSAKIDRAKCSPFKNKAAAPGRVEAAHVTTTGTKNYTPQLAFWILAYELEESRQKYADAGHVFRQVGCAAALAALRLIGGRV